MPLISNSTIKLVKVSSLLDRPITGTAEYVIYCVDNGVDPKTFWIWKNSAWEEIYTTITDQYIITRQLTGLTITGGTVTSTDTILSAFGKLQNQLNAVASPMVYQGTWNANTNFPVLTSSVGTKGYVYRVTTSGATNIDGTTDWKSGDFIVFNGTTWDKWDSTDAVTSVNGYVGNVVLVKSDVGLGNVPNVDATNPANIVQNTNYRFVTDTEKTYWNGKQDALGYVPEDVANKATTMTENTTSNVKYLTSKAVYDWGTSTFIPLNTSIVGATKTKITYDSKGLVTAGADATTADIADSLNKRYVTDANLIVIGNTSNINTGDETQSSIKTKLGEASATQDGYLSAFYWSAFNNKQSAISLTNIGSSGAASFISNTLNIPVYTISGLGGVSISRNINTTAPLQGGGDLSADRTLSITQATISSSGYLSSTDWNTFNNKQNALSGGILNRITKWTSTTGIGNSQIADDGTSIAIGASLNSTVQLGIATNKATALKSSSSTGIGINGISTNSTGGTGVKGESTGGYGLFGSSNSTTVDNVGVYGSATDSVSLNIGGKFVALGTSGSKYSVQLQDGTESAGKFLKSITADGKANWANITSSDISGISGSYVPYTGATANVNIGVYSVIANNGTYNTEMSPSYFGVQNTAETIFGLLEYNKLTITNSTIPSTMEMNATGLVFPNGSIQTTAATGTVTSVAALTLGTTGTDISSTVATGTTTPVITLNIPTASATNRGALSAANWTDFNNKTNGSGTANYLPLWSNSNTLATSAVYQDPATSNVGIGTSTPTVDLHIARSTTENFYISLANSAGPLGETTTTDTTKRSRLIARNDVNTVSIGQIGTTNTAGVTFGAPGDSYLSSSATSQNLNIVKQTGDGSTTDHIKLFAGDLATATPSMIILGSGTTKGNVGIGIAAPTNKLHVAGSFKVDTAGTISTPANTLGWYRLATSSITNRGGIQLIYSTTGGFYAPVTFIIKAFKDYGTVGTIILEKYGTTPYIKRVRLIVDEVDSSVYHIEGEIAANTNGLIFNVYVQKILGHESTWNVNLGLLAVSTSTGTPIRQNNFIANSGGISSPSFQIQNNLTDNLWEFRDGSLNSVPGVLNLIGSSSNVIMSWDDTNTRVGIGLPSSINPTAKLHINNLSSSDSFLVEDSTNPDGTPFVIDSAGNVGIGLAAPTNKLHISSTTSGAFRLVDTTQGSNKYLKSNASGVGTWSALSVADTGLTITTTGTSGAATLVGNTLNIPQYSGGASQTLAQTLALGNTTGANDISLSYASLNYTQSIKAAGNTINSYISFEDLGGSVFIPSLRTANGTGFNKISIENSQVLSRAFNGTADTTFSLSPGTIDAIITDGLGNYNSFFDIDHFSTSIGSKYYMPNPGFTPYEYTGAVNTQSGSGSGNETWAELRSNNYGSINSSYIRSTNLGGAYPANILQVTDSSIDSKIEQNANQILISSTNTSFAGAQYDQDWSANFTARTLVDKAYVDTAVSTVTAGSASSVSHTVKAGVALTIGQAVYVSSADGTNMIVSKADYSVESTSSKTVGLIAQNLSLNGIGQVITEGLLAGLNTSTANAGDAVWLGDDGNLLYGLANKPSAPNHLVFIGIVTRVNANNGEIFIKPQNGFEVHELHDVSINSIADNDVLTYETATGLWKNKPQAFNYGLSYTVATQNLLY